MGHIIIGAFFGDEGKGAVTQNICKNAVQNGDRVVVVRFSGGHQCGHTILHEGKKIVVHSYGSGSLLNIPTYIGPGVTLFPPLLLKEKESINACGAYPSLFIDPLAYITTPYDIVYNRVREGMLKHGSCGLGVGATIERHENNVPFFGADLQHAPAAAFRMQQVRAYYEAMCKKAGLDFGLMEKAAQDFISSDPSLRNSLDYEAYSNGRPEEPKFGFIKTISEVSYILEPYNWIFEGNQGVLLDREIGTFPHVTRSKTTSRVALDLGLSVELSPEDDQYVEIVMRPYITRHGNGPTLRHPTNGILDFLESPLQLINTETETNTTGRFQGEFRTKPFSQSLFEYAIRMLLSDDCKNRDGRLPTYRLWVTCMDQLNDPEYVDEMTSFLSYVKSVDCSLPISEIFLSKSEGEFYEFND